MMERIDVRIEDTQGERDARFAAIEQMLGELVGFRSQAESRLAGVEGWVNFYNAPNARQKAIRATRGI